jgi:Rap1a immunity proteins
MVKTLYAIFFTVTFLCLIPQKAEAAALFSGEYLIQICDVDGRGNEKVKGGMAACQSYISGVIDYHNMLRSMDLTSNMNFCVPHDITLNELQMNVLGYLKRNKKLHRNFVAAPAVAMALFSTYPCSKKRG